MRRFFTPLLVLLFLLLAATGVILWLTKPSAGEAFQESALQVKQAPDEPKQSVPDMTEPKGERQSVSSQTSVYTADPARYKRTYMLSLEGNRLSLESVQDIEGDFAARRRQPQEWSGMLRCRLTDANGQTLAEEILAAPDQLCTVLDSHDGVPKPVKLAIPGPVIFQVRLPRVADAHHLDVYRIQGPGRLAHDQRIGSISLNEK